VRSLGGKWISWMSWRGRRMRWDGMVWDGLGCSEGWRGVRHLLCPSSHECEQTESERPRQQKRF